MPDNIPEKIEDSILGKSWDPGKLIREELGRNGATDSPNNWIFCYGSILMARESMFVGVQDTIPAEKAEEIEELLGVMKLEFRQLMRKYPDVEHDCPEEERKALIQKLIKLSW